MSYLSKLPEGQTILVPTDISYLEKILFDESGNLQPVSFDLLEDVPQNDISVFCHKHGVYQIITTELVEFVRAAIGVSNAIEIGHAFVPRKRKINGFSFCQTCGNREPNPMHNNRQFKNLGEQQYSDWVIVGGESGNNARVCVIDWIRLIVQQCQTAGTKVFVKQLGANVWMKQEEWRAMSAKDKPLHRTPGQNDVEHGMRITHFKISTGNIKGGDISRFPIDLRIREIPDAA